MRLGNDYFNAYVMNTQTSAMSQYNNYAFNAFASFNNTTFGSFGNNIYELTGPDDAGTQIDALLRTGMTDFGDSRYKRIHGAYMGYTSDGTVVLRVTTTDSGDKKTYWYRSIAQTANSSRELRIPVGKGLQSRYWQFELINETGADFEIDVLELVPVMLDRRIS